MLSRFDLQVQEIEWQVNVINMNYESFGVT